MEQSKFRRYFLILISILFLESCQHGLIEERKIHFKEIEFSSNIQDSFKQKSKKYFIISSEKNFLSLKVSSLKFQKKNYYGGSSARAKQIEIIGFLDYSFQNDLTKKNGVLKTSGWIPINEENPQAEIMAQKELINELEDLLLHQLMQEYWLIES
ncbi:MAG: hypothetical protein CMD68_05695 [Gammaproteobacteria bacterium]|nr:hypothetical protein [Gammaproteobacteria bacterium]